MHLLRFFYLCSFLFVASQSTISSLVLKNLMLKLTLPWIWISIIIKSAYNFTPENGYLFSSDISEKNDGKG